MLTIESKTGMARGSQEDVYRYVSDFRNFAHLLPEDKMKDLRLSGDTIRFTMDGIGTIGLLITKKTPNSGIVIRATEGSPADFTLRINIAEERNNQSPVNLILEANLNMFLEMMAKGPLQQFVDLIADKIGEVEFGV
ncbi:MAG TPA: hypothetical protein VJ203_12195 [Bacteroidales bacterium]|nr:hypothetical protein [Bacteroidales bacterium]